MKKNRLWMLTAIHHTMGGLSEILQYKVQL